MLDPNAISSYAAPWVIDFPLLLIPICLPKSSTTRWDQSGVPDKLAEIVLLQFQRQATLEIVSTKLKTETMKFILLFCIWSAILARLFSSWW